MNKFLGVLLLTMIAMATVAGAGDYQPRLLLAGNWGSREGEFGLSLQAEGNCPQALAIANDSSLAILDAVNHRVQFFSDEGKWLRSFAVLSNAFDIQFQNQELLVLTPYDHVIARYGYDGQLIEKIAINPKINLIDGLRSVENEVLVQTIEQVQYSITNNQAQQIASARLGASARVPNIKIRTQWIAPHQGQMIIQNEPSGQTQTVMIAVPDELGSLVFLDTDRNANIFVRKELFSTSGRSYFEVAKFDRNGGLIATIKIEHENIVMPYKPIAIDQYGNVYFLAVTRDGFSVVQWQEK